MSKISRPLAGFFTLILAACGGDDSTTASPIPLAAIKTVTIDTSFVATKSLFGTLHASCLGEDVVVKVGSGAFFITTTTVDGEKTTQSVESRWPTLHGVGQTSGLIYSGHSEADFREAWVYVDPDHSTFTLHSKDVFHTMLRRASGEVWRVKSLYEVRDEQPITNTSVEDCR